MLYDKEEGKKAYPAVAPPSGVPSFRARQAGSAQTRPAGSNMRSPFSACRTLQSARQRGKEMQVINGQCSIQVPQGLRCIRKARSDPPSSAPAGGEVRRGCRARRASSAPAARWEQRRAVGRRPTGEAGSPSLPSFLAKQERRPPAGGGGGVSRSMLRAAVAGRVCKPGRGKIPANLTPNTGTPARKSPTQETPLFAPACTQPGARRRTRVNTAR